MTTAVCFKCGSMKFGAFNACPECSAKPVSEDDYAMSLAMTEHYFPKTELEKMAHQVANGEKLHIDPEVKWRFIQLLKAEGVGEQTPASTPYIPTETLNLFAASEDQPSQKWWQFWKR